MKPERYARDPVAFIDDLVRLNERGQPFRLFDHQREILRAAFAFDADGRLSWDTFVYSTTKKSGKTTLNAALLIWWAFTQEAPNEVFILANDQEQAQARVFSSAARIIQRNPALAESATVETRRIVLSNGTTIIALASEFRGAAGSNHGLTSWDELWAYSSEASRRLWDELTGVPTRRNSIRIVTTYAGWEGESELLFELYKLGVGPEEHPQGEAEPIHATLPLYFNPEARLLVYWDHEARMPWQTARYLEAQRRSLRPGTYLRLHENRWTAAEGSFIEPEAWAACVEEAWAPADPDPELQIWAAFDLSVKHDSTALVAVTVDPETNQVVLVWHRIWQPSPEQPIDLENTVERATRELHAHFRVRAVYADPYQAHRSLTTLRRAGIPVQEYPQTVPNLTRMAQVLDDLLRSRQLVLYPADDLRAHALNAAAMETAQGYRIVKRAGSRRIDGLVALAMAATAAADVPWQAPMRLTVVQGSR
jgi:phage terminase large subunit-like protein